MKKLIKHIRVWFMAFWDIGNTRWLAMDAYTKASRADGSAGQAHAKVDISDTKIKELEERLRRLESLVDVSVDAYSRSSESWAVICLSGKTDYIKFLYLGEKNMMEIREFLRRYPRANRIADVPGHPPRHFYFEDDGGFV